MKKTLSHAYVSIQHFPNKLRPLCAPTHAHCALFSFSRSYTLQCMQQMHNGYQQSTSSYNTADDVLVRLLSAKKKYNDNICQNVSDQGAWERERENIEALDECYHTPTL